MDISGLIQSYDSRASSSAALTRTMAAPPYVSTNAYNGVTTGNMMPTQQQLQPHNPFSFNGYGGGNSNTLMPPYTSNYIRPRQLPGSIEHENDSGRRQSCPGSNPRGFVEDIQGQSPPIKAEPYWNSQISSSSSFVSPTTKKSPAIGSSDVSFVTEVDTLMKAIQAKSQTPQPQTKSSPVQNRLVEGVSLPSISTHRRKSCPGDTMVSKLSIAEIQHETSSKCGKRSYQCTIGNCGKVFYQKTHLDIHERAHTGDKPYHCKEPGCGRSFSQLGNLKTHKRRHTGERPYKCDVCDKRFAQRGNVRAHRIVHEQAKPYICRLDDCGKQFTQLGNLKSHQNKFHIATIRTLTSKFASIQDGDLVHAADKSLWEYFANLYKNSNKGIKGRGKDRKVGPSSRAMSSGMKHVAMAGAEGYSLSGTGRGNMVMSIGTNGIPGPVHSERSQYSIYDADDESQSGHSGSGASSTGTCYDDAPSDGFVENGRVPDLGYNERMY